ncbi:MAG: GMC oxidoreductase [Vicinamibacterales bacterium]
MLIDARTLADGATLEADVCIAGAGAAGMTIALDLRGSGLSVLLLESGGVERDEATQALSEGRMTGIDTWDMRRMRIRALGGTTGHWNGWCRPLMAQDFERRDYIPDSGWPVTYSELLPWFRKACRTVEIGEFEWDADERSERTAKPLLPLSSNVEQRYYQYSPPTRFSTVYGPVLEQAEDVRVVTWANLVDIRLDQTRGSVEGFACRTLDGTSFRVTAGRYVLALGGIENARVLLASRSQQREGVANGHDVVGRYFMEHPHYYGSIGVVHAAALDLSFYRRGDSDWKRADGSPVQMLGALALSRAVSKREKLLNFSATFLPAARANAPKTESDLVPAATAQALVTRGRGEFTATQLTLRCEQSPLRDSRITLGDDVDALGMPRVALDWRIAPEDDVQMRRAMVILGRELGAAGLARLWVPGDAARFAWRQDPGGHHMGATRMGKDPAVSVVDATSRTHEVRNLYITGGSVFTTGGDSNPTLTVVALAHRLADTLMAGRGNRRSGA